MADEHRDEDVIRDRREDERRVSQFHEEYRLVFDHRFVKREITAPARIIFRIVGYLRPFAVRIRPVRMAVGEIPDLLEIMVYAILVFKYLLFKPTF